MRDLSRNLFWDGCWVVVECRKVLSIVLNIFWQLSHFGQIINTLELLSLYLFYCLLGAVGIFFEHLVSYESDEFIMRFGLLCGFGSAEFFSNCRVRSTVVQVADHI